MTILRKRLEELFGSRPSSSTLRMTDIREATMLIVTEFERLDKRTKVLEEQAKDFVKLGKELKVILAALQESLVQIDTEVADGGRREIS